MQRISERTFWRRRSCLSASLSAEKIWDLQILRRLRHFGETGSQATERRWWSELRTPSGTALSEKERSCFCITSPAAAAEEITTEVMQPSFSDITGPCIRARPARVRWALSPRERRFPITGRGGGPGGSCLLLSLLDADRKARSRLQSSTRHRT